VRDLLFGQTIDRVRHQLEVPMLIARPGRDSAPSTAALADPSAALSGPAGTHRSSDFLDPVEARQE
jgi:hypothetical protein